MAKNRTISVQGFDIVWYEANYSDYISLTDIARYRSSDPRITIHSWLRSRDIVEFATRLNYWGFGKAFTILILNPSNSTGLENKLD